MFGVLAAKKSLEIVFFSQQNLFKFSYFQISLSILLFKPFLPLITLKLIAFNRILPKTEFDPHKFKNVLLIQCNLDKVMIQIFQLFLNILLWIPISIISNVAIHFLAEI